MKPVASLSSLLSLLFVATFCVAQQIPEMPTPTEEHQWLEKFVGQWTSVAKGSMGPGQEEFTCNGGQKSDMLGGFWLVSTGFGEPMGMTVHTQLTLGYDEEKEKFVGTWIDSTNAHMWKYEGTLDKQQDKLTLETEGPNMMGDGKVTKFRDSFQFKSADHYVMTSEMQDENGKWQKFMSADVRRK